MKMLIKSTVLLTATIILSACSTTDVAQENQDNGRYVLYGDNGLFVSQHKNYNDCHAAAIRYNIRKVNNDTGIDKTYRSTPNIPAKTNATCRDITS